MDDRIDSPLDGAEASPATATTTTSSSGDALAQRYPKRKRNEVKYADSDEDWVSTNSEESDFHPEVKKVKKEKPLAKKDIFPFTKLPAELRNKIYNECLTDDDDVYLINTVFLYRRTVTRANAEAWAHSSRTHNRSWRWGDADGSRKKAKPMVGKLKPLSPHLLTVSKAIYAEAANILFCQPIVVLDNLTLFHFAGMQTAKTASMIRNLTIAFWCHTAAYKQMNYAAMTLLSAVGMVHLDRLHLDGRLRPYGTCGNLLARKVYRDCYPWIHALGNAKGNRYAALDVVEMSEVNFEAWMDHRPEDVRAEELEKSREEFRDELQSLIQYAL